ncbi:MAG: hypothetical protein D6718_10130 [Acidobacteria bacterium]|nr:MAG: hypothetical protein D6718_10130 [Acidobacteriota bacterium]
MISVAFTLAAALSAPAGLGAPAQPSSLAAARIGSDAPGSAATVAPDTPASVPDCGELTCNVTGSAFVVAWFGEEPAVAALRIGRTPDSLGEDALCDDRDDTPGCGLEARAHYVTVTGLEPETTYYVQRFENGRPAGPLCRVKTGAVLRPRLPQTRYGRVVQDDGVTPAADTFVRYEIRGPRGRSAALCDLVRAEDEGYWVLDRGGVRTADHAAYYTPRPDDVEVVAASAGAAGLRTRQSRLAEANPLPDIVVPRTPPGSER